jgi:hypothetical protein
MNNTHFISIHKTRGIITTTETLDDNIEIYQGTEEECHEEMDNIESKLDDYNTFHARQIRLSDIITYKQFLKYIEHES